MCLIPSVLPLPSSPSRPSSAHLPSALLLPPALLLHSALLPTSLEQSCPPLQAAVPAFLPELELTLQQAEVRGILQSLSQARLPPAQLLLPARQLEQITLLQVGPSLGWGHSRAWSWKGRQDLPPSQARKIERRETSERPLGVFTALLEAGLPPGGYVPILQSRKPRSS